MLLQRNFNYQGTVSGCLRVGSRITLFGPGYEPHGVSRKIVEVVRFDRFDRDYNLMCKVSSGVLDIFLGIIFINRQPVSTGKSKLSYIIGQTIAPGQTPQNIIISLGFFDPGDEFENHPCIYAVLD